MNSQHKQDTGPVREVDKLPRIANDPYPRYRALRESDPVYYNEETQWWEVLSYRDVKQVFADHVTFPTEPLASDPDDEDRPIKNLSAIDPPGHTRIRTLVAQVVNPETIAQLTPLVSKATDELLNPHLSSGQLDVVKDFSYQLPLRALTKILGVPQDEGEHFIQLADVFLNTSQEKDTHPVKELTRYFKKLIALRRNDAGDDLVSRLLAANIDGNHLTEPELLSFCVLFVNAGVRSSSNNISNAILCFDSYPEALEALQNDLSLLPDAIEEVLRYLSSVQMLARYVAKDTVLGGKEIKEGSIVAAVIGSANRDEEQFSHPNTLDITRKPNPHLTFGNGIHLCIAAPLARLYSRVALEALLGRTKNIQRVREIPLTIFPSPFVYGATSLPITFEAK